MNKKKVITIVIIIALLLIPIPIKLKNGDKEYRSLLYKYTKNHRPNEYASSGYEDGYRFELLGCTIRDVTDITIDISSHKVELFNIDEIERVTIVDYINSDIYYEYDNQEVITKLYNLFSDLEYRYKGKNNTITNVNEKYVVTFYNNDNSKKVVEVYNKDNSYYAEQEEVGIFKLTKEEFELVVGFLK